MIAVSDIITGGAFTLAGVALGGAFTLATTWVANRHARNVSRDDNAERRYIWQRDRRLDAYATIAERIMQIRSAVGQPAAVADADIDPVYTEAEWLSARARVHVVASREVREGLAALQVRLLEARTERASVKALRTVGGSELADAVKANSVASVALIRYCDELVDLLNREIA